MDHACCCLTIPFRNYLKGNSSTTPQVPTDIALKVRHKFIISDPRPSPSYKDQDVWSQGLHHV
ncbi:hypothetical protein CY34DRAFT_799982 [Suillus luteus UH-Slu-Lm8-n1]|uniref:Uncharacterized protein n=1 Tax=Suillus luteus UH-Slu-Lm8-n1 TaxID=930992 RepID=A0A0D0BLN9_9AGAM|nr:hypothetical protein CY34DRAFT_799982 [Suillus luteus UH-Slu-Lm8-n1]